MTADVKDADHSPYAQTETIVPVLRAASSHIQPFFGYLSGRLERIRLVPAGVAVAALSVIGMGAAPNYLGCLAPVTVGSLGIAARLTVGFGVVAGGMGVGPLGMAPERGNLLAAMRVPSAVPPLALPFVWALPADAPSPQARLQGAKTAAR